MKPFWRVPVWSLEDAGDRHLEVVHPSDLTIARARNVIERDGLLLVRGTPFDDAARTFSRLSEEYGIVDSYALQMQYVAHSMKDRKAVDDVAVNVNDRGPLQIIQPHSEGDSTSQLDLFGLYCVSPAMSGGENILSLIDQRADHSNLRAKEKAILGADLSADDVAQLREDHLDARVVLAHCPSICRVLKQTSAGQVVVRAVPLEKARSALTGELYATYWDNVTVHDHAFHRFQFELLKHLALLHGPAATDYRPFMHVEEDSPWGPADSDSGSLEQTSSLFRCHVRLKLQAGDLLVFHNRAWTHAVNNWPVHEQRQLLAMYA